MFIYICQKHISRQNKIALTICINIIVEILQYFNYAQILFGDNKIAKTLLGSSFDIKDILCYVVGYLIIILIEKISHERKEAKQNENSR